MSFVVALMAITGFALVTSGTAEGTTSDQSAPGVTPTSIKLGITYLDSAAIQDVVNINPGNYQVAYTALIDQINAKGGINGRKIVPVFEPINPIGTASAANACTALTQDDKVFAVIGFFQAADSTCYVETHDTPLIGTTLSSSQAAQAKAPWFNNGLSANNGIPREMAAFAREGAFANKKVAVVGDTSDQAEIDLVLPELKKLKVNVVQTAVNGVPDDDQAATNSELGIIAEKFKAAGANVGNCRRGRRRELARGAAEQPKYLPAEVDRPGPTRLRNRRIQQSQLYRRRTQERVGRWRRPAPSGGVERSGDEALRRHRPRCRAEGSHQRPRDRNRVDSGDLARPRDRVPTDGAVRGHCQGRRQNAEQHHLQPRRGVPDASHASRRGRNL